MRNKEFFINAVRLIDVGGSPNVPTVLFYQTKQSVLIGSAALAAAKSPLQINADFKIDLGYIEPTSLTPHKTFITASGESKSATGLGSSFLHELLIHARSWLASNAVEEMTNVMLAEPLALQGELASADWLSKYRRNLERILSGKRLNIKKISFLPEPFAVFQYYRHGLRHPVVAERTKQNVLVIDFGGGTFDVCIIETNREGDISQTGRNSRPLAASSTPIGGFFINRMIAEHLIRKTEHSKAALKKLGKALDVYKKWIKVAQDLTILSDEYSNFVRNLHGLTYQVENLKLTICRNITNWSIDAPLSLKAPIAVPNNMYARISSPINIVLSASEMRDIFIKKVWNPHLKVIVHRALQRAKEELGGAPISVVLLSGGSANIGWLYELLCNDFAEELGDSEILRLPDFQEVVAKGLAVECARRFYNEDGDFSSVTYNRLCLILDSDRRGYQLKPFKPRMEGLPDVGKKPGVLLPSASVLKNFIQKPMRWRVRLDRPPHKQLDYYFLRSSFDPADLENLQNVVDKTVYTPPDCSFDNAIQLELFVKPDSTAIPTFIYKTGRTEDETIKVKGKPFYLDMTYGQVEQPAKAYIGLDFGTSNTSISFVDQFSIETYQRRSTEKTWRGLNDLVNTLPYPLAAYLSQYLSQSDSGKLVQKAREFIEAALTLAAYITYLDYCSEKGKEKTKILRGFTQRSAGPLWDLLKTCLTKLGKKESISTPYNELLADEFRGPIDDAIKFLAQYKHDKTRESSFDTLRPVQILANISQKVFLKNTFGFFENVQKQKFGKEYQGQFRHAHGVHPPFIKFSTYKGTLPFSEDDPILFNSLNGTALSLQPLLFWDSCPEHPDLDNGHCYLFDKEEIREGQFSFKAVGYPCTCNVSTSNEYANLAEFLTEFRDHDRNIDRFEVGFLEEVSLV